MRSCQICFKDCICCKVPWATLQKLSSKRTCLPGQTALKLAEMISCPWTLQLCRSSLKEFLEGEPVDEVEATLLVVLGLNYLWLGGRDSATDPKATS